MSGFQPLPSALYFCDNGAVYCGEHLGETARVTGRDISGQPIEKITSGVYTQAEKLHGHSDMLACEKPGCGR